MLVSLFAISPFFNFTFNHFLSALSNGNLLFLIDPKTLIFGNFKGSSFSFKGINFLSFFIKIGIGSPQYLIREKIQSFNL